MIDVSLGPYPLNSPHGSTSRNRRTSRMSSASPPHSTRRSVRQPANSGSSSTCRNMVGTKCAVVTASRWISRTNPRLSNCRPGPATTTAPPAISGERISCTDASNPIDALCSTRSSAPKPNHS